MIYRMASTAVRRGLRAAAASVAACRVATVGDKPTWLAAGEGGGSYHTAAALRGWRATSAARGASALGVSRGCSSNSAALIGVGGGGLGGALGGVVGRAAPGAAALPFTLQMLVGL